MASYVQLGEVHTYYEEDGQGEPLVLLHPGGADSRVFESKLPGLSGQFRVFRPCPRRSGRNTRNCQTGAGTAGRLTSRVRSPTS